MMLSRWHFLHQLAISFLIAATFVTTGYSQPKFVLKWGTLGSGSGEFNGPHGVVVDGFGTVFVADTGNNRIQKFTADGSFITEWGSFGAGDGQFNHPHGIAVDGLGDLYVTETGNNRIQKFTSDGTFVTKWGSFGNGNGQFQHLHGLAVDGAGNVYAADRDQNRIQKFSSDGLFIDSWGTFGTDDGQFSQPNGVAVDSGGNVYVADTSARIQKFTSDGDFLMSRGAPGNKNGQFNFPRGLSTDALDNLYVADRNNNRIQIFTSTGDFITKWGVFGADDGQFNFPYAVAAGLDGDVYVADSANHRIQLFAIPLAETVVPDSLTVTRGLYVAGDETSLAASDNVDLALQRLITDIQSRTEFEVKSVSPTATPTSFEFTVEGAVFARSNVVQTIELFDYVAAAWELVDTMDAARSPNPDSVVTATPTGDLSRFVEAGTMCIEARIHFQSDSPRQRFASNTDQAIWTIGQ